jgi:hypothetical protein
MPELRIDAGDRSTLAIGAMVQFRESYTYLGRAPLRLSATAPDPMTVLIVEQMRVRRAASMMRASIGRKGFESVRGFDLWPRVGSIRVSSAAPTNMQADGEIYRGVTGLDVQHRPESLVFITPARAQRKSST